MIGGPVVGPSARVVSSSLSEQPPQIGDHRPHGYPETGVFEAA
jgi:hypothetical protein